jgi:preprotein translocase subunit YajC
MLISNAHAQSLLSGLTLDSVSGFLPIILMFVVLYFLMIRPQQKRQKEQKDMIAALTKGDEVVTSGGLLGIITRVSENHVAVEVAAGTEILMQKTAIVAQLPKGTLKSL